MKQDELIDLAGDWVGGKDAAYLAKENVVVYYESNTGRKSDYSWHSMTLPEVVRIIQATKMNPADFNLLKTNHVITACQELDRVFEFAIKSRHQVRPGLFNYLEEAKMTLGDEIMATLADTLLSDGYTALLLSDVLRLYDGIQLELGCDTPKREKTHLYMKHFPPAGFHVRVGTNRVQWSGTKTSALMQVSAKPKDITPIKDDTNVIKRVVGVLK